MNAEIKEIIDYIFIECNEEWGKQLENYITNLQQKDFESQKEIMKLKDKLERQRKEYQDDYKDVRIEIKEKNERIANLQQENETLKEKINTLKSNFEVEIDDCENYKKWYRDYKSRCEKALAEINYWGIDKEHNDNSAMRVALGNILNILTGGEENDH